MSGQPVRQYYLLVYQTRHELLMFIQIEFK